MNKNTKIIIKLYTLALMFIVILLSSSIGNCFAMREPEDTISNLSFSHDGKKVVFDRCQNEGCQIQVYDLETGELAAYQSPKNERWTMGKYSYDGKKITFSVIPVKFTGNLDLGEMQIAVMDADGKNYKKVTTGPGAKLYPAFSHNGKKILYACAAYIRKEGRTPAGQYDAWEVNLKTGEQTRLTFFEYFYMSNLTYFPDDERFIYYGDRPGVFEGLKSYPNEDAFGKKMAELKHQGKSINTVVVMKGKELIPMPYNFGEKFRPEKPLLSQDGSMLIFEKSVSAGKFYLYSPDGNHRLVGSGGSVGAAAISLDGGFLGFGYEDKIVIKTVKDGSPYRAIILPKKAKSYGDLDARIKNNPGLRLLPELPSKIVNASDK